MDDNELDDIVELIKPTPPPKPSLPTAMPGAGNSAPPVNGGAPASPGVGGMKPGAMRAQPVPKLPLSQFAGTSGMDGPPQMDIQPLKQPDTHVTIEYTLEEMARVLQELAEVQDDPAWSQAHVTLAEQWRAAAEMLLNHAVAGHQAQGDAELKQQQLMMNHELHQQTLSQNDQKHVQDLRHTEDKHKLGLRHEDQMHKFGLIQQKQNIQSQSKLSQQKINTQQQVDKAKVSQARKPTPRPSA